MYLPPVLSHWECTLTPLVESVQSPPQRGGGKEGQGQGSSCLMTCPGGIHPSCGVCGMRVCTYQKYTCNSKILPPSLHSCPPLQISTLMSPLFSSRPCLLPSHFPPSPLPHSSSPSLLHSLPPPLPPSLLSLPPPLSPLTHLGSSTSVKSCSWSTAEGGAPHLILSS